METKEQIFVERAKKEIHELHIGAIRELLKMWGYKEDETYKDYKLRLETSGIKLKRFELSCPFDCLYFELTMEDILFVLENDVPLSVYRLWTYNYPTIEGRSFITFADIYKGEKNFKKRPRH